MSISFLETTMNLDRRDILVLTVRTTINVGPMGILTFTLEIRKQKMEHTSQERAPTFHIDILPNFNLLHWEEPPRSKPRVDPEHN